MIGGYDSSYVRVPLWEMESGFNPVGVGVRQKPAWVTLGGEIPSPATHGPSAEDVLKNADFDINSLPLRDPNFFVSGQIHEHLSNWQVILRDTVQSENIMNWLENGVNVNDFFTHFKGNFKGKAYDSYIPPRHYFQNSKNCVQFVDFICKELCERIATGSIKL